MRSNKARIDHPDGNFPEGMTEAIHEFFKYKHPYLDKGKDAYDAIFENGYMFPLQRKREMARMMQIARSIKPRVVMEIGADKGGSLYHWCHCLPTVKGVIACEIRGTPYAEIFEKAFPHISFLWLQESSYTDNAITKVWNAPLGSSINCLFIDGDKSAFEKDFDAYLPRMNSHGIVFMHDINDREPRHDYDRVVNRGYRHHEIIDITEVYDPLERQRQGIPPAHAHEGWLRYWEGRSAGVGVIYLDGEKR